MAHFIRPRNLPLSLLSKHQDHVCYLLVYMNSLSVVTAIELDIYTVKETKRIYQLHFTLNYMEVIHIQEIFS